MDVTKLIPNQWYCVTVSEACTITAEDGTGYTQTLATPSKAGQYMVKTISDKLSIDDDDHALVEGPFKVAPAGGLGGGEFDGHLDGNLYVGNGDEPAVAAVCTLTLGNLTTGGTLEDSNGQSVELENPHKYATGTVSIPDATAAGTLTIGEWSKEWEAKTDAKAYGTFATMAAEGEVITVTNGGVDYPVSVLAYPDYESVDGWNAAFTAAGCGIVCTAVEAIGEIVLSVEAAETGETGNSIVISVENYEPVTLAGGSTARTAVDVYNDIHDDEDCPVDVTLDADEQDLVFTAKEYGVNDEIAITGSMFSDAAGMSGGHGDYSVAELVTAIAGEFDDITPTAGETEGTITLTANTAGAAANAITYTATGCFGSGTVKQGSTTRGKNAVEQTAFKIYLNGAELDVEPAPVPTALTPTTAMRNGGVYTVDADIDARNVTLPANATARIWAYKDTGPLNVQWPSWKWLTEDGMQPEFDYFKQYRLQVERDNHATTAKVVDSYEVRPEFVHESLTESNRTNTSLQLYLLAAETSQSAGAYDSNDKGPQEAFNSNGDKYYSGFTPVNEKNLLGDEFIPTEMPAGFPLSYGHHQAVTFCTARALNVHAISAELWSSGGAKALFQARVNDTWVDIGGEITMTTGKRNYILHPEAAVVASKFRLLFTGAWVNRNVDKIRIFEK
ncbi:MAG: hypothetical protein Q4C88_06805 [Akkermansia sp.]|nr:hypothetical protein [Akkermansia sp.]